MNTFEQLESKFTSGDALVGIIGLGYVGLPLAHTLHARAGSACWGSTSTPPRCTALAEGRRTTSSHLGAELTRDLASQPPLRGDHRLRPPEPSPTPSSSACPRPWAGTRSRTCRTSINSGTRDRPPHCAAGSWWCSSRPATRAPRATSCCKAMFEARPKPALSRSSAGKSTTSWPTAPSARTRATSATPPAPFPSWSAALDPAERHARLRALPPHREAGRTSSRSAEVAETAKLLENIFRAVNIALVNEMKTLLTDMGIDVWEVIEAAATKPFGFMPFYPGPGPGRPLHPHRPLLPHLEGQGDRPAARDSSSLPAR
jgi:UDP-N-acetyl-D-glucosamine dehydrogenase